MCLLGQIQDGAFVGSLFCFHIVYVAIIKKKSSLSSATGISYFKPL